MTPHISSKKEDIAKTVIMPGDPLRAKYIAENFLEDYKEVNSVRNILAYTGYYQGKQVTIFASGMGIPSMGIYAYELYKFYDVETIIRIGSCGSFKENINLFDLILVDNAISETSFGKTFSNYNYPYIASTKEVNSDLKEAALKLNKTIHEGNVYCSEAFYNIDGQKSTLIEDFNCLAVEMESYALFLIAAKLNKKAACLLTVSDSVVKKEETTAEERQTGFTEMMEVALSAIR